MRGGWVEVSEAAAVLLRVADACPVGIDALSTVEGGEGRWRVVTAGGSAAHCWDVDTGPTGSVVLPAQASFGNVESLGVARSVDGREVVVGASWIRGLGRWDAVTGVPFDPVVSDRLLG